MRKRRLFFSVPDHFWHIEYLSYSAHFERSGKVRHWSKFSPAALWTLLLLLIGCSSASVNSTKSATESIDSDTVLDFRLPVLAGAGLPAESEHASLVKAAVYGTPYPHTVHVSDPVSGSFTVAQESQSVYLLTRTDNSNALLAVFASRPNPEGEFSIGNILGQFVLDEPYQQLLLAKDTNNDAIDELMLLQQDFHMGVLVKTLDILSLQDMQLSHTGQESFVLEDRCAIDDGIRSLRASRLQFIDSTVVRDDFILPCAN